MEEESCPLIVRSKLWRRKVGYCRLNVAYERLTTETTHSGVVRGACDVARMALIESKT